MRKIWLAIMTVLAMQPHILMAQDAAPVPQEQTSDDYREQAERALQRLQSAPPPRTKARNLIIFIGDGMGVSTLTAGRIYAGQSAGQDGESTVTAMDALDHTALVKTYSHDGQVSDSAPTATAIMAGVKTRNGVIGVGPETKLDDCASGLAHRVPSIFEMAQNRKLATGVITTTRITHATPAAAYAHSAQRDWESDSDMPATAIAAGCTDIARQMVEGTVGKRLDILLGGGRSYFLPKAVKDPEYPEKSGFRSDGTNLIANWQSANPGGQYIWNKAQFDAIDVAARKTGSGPKLLGLFEPGHMNFEADRAKDKSGEPALSDMVEKSIRILSRNRTGYVLLVEGGRIDHAHHGGNARRALEDTKAFDAAIARAVAMVDLKDTLIVTTADHSHTLTISGYPSRGNPILATVNNSEIANTPERARDGKGYTTLGYANGPGAVNAADRADPALADTAALDYRQQALIPLSSETHGGEDVVVRASGPGAHLFRGTIEQHVIFYIMETALFGRKKR